MLPPHLLAGLDRIDAALLAVEDPSRPPDTLFVCRATEDEWNEFVETDGHVFPPKFLEWFPDSGEIHIIEFATTPHECYVSEFLDESQITAAHVRPWLRGSLSACNRQGRRSCPDMSYGPAKATPNVVVPPGVPSVGAFKTIKIDVGASQSWGMAPGQLDYKAISIWGVVPGVEYVLCVKFDPDFSNAQYKLYDLRVRPLVPLAPLPIVAPRTEIQLDGHRVLGIPPEMPLPENFPPVLSLDLYAPLEWAMH